MTEPAYKPYREGPSAFEFGLRRLDLSKWLEKDAHFDRYVDEKQRLWQSSKDEIYYCEPEAEPACCELVNLVSKATGSPTTQDCSSLWSAALMVQEDLVIMQASPRGWRLTAASLCFPSSWRLKDKAGKELDQIHDPVPGFGPGSRKIVMMDRMFTGLKVDQPVWRLNWSLDTEPDLYHPDGHKLFNNAFDGQDMYIRVERQTLRKLPKTGAICFTIRIYVDPLKALRQDPKAAQGLASDIERLDSDQADYKGLNTARLTMIQHLRSF